MKRSTTASHRGHTTNSKRDNDDLSTLHTEAHEVLTLTSHPTVLSDGCNNKMDVHLLKDQSNKTNLNEAFENSKAPIAAKSSTLQSHSTLVPSQLHQSRKASFCESHLVTKDLMSQVVDTVVPVNFNLSASRSGEVTNEIKLRTLEAQLKIQFQRMIALEVQKRHQETMSISGPTVVRTFYIYFNVNILVACILSGIHNVIHFFFFFFSDCAGTRTCQSNYRC